jgi:hypothetical protein
MATKCQSIGRLKYFDRHLKQLLRTILSPYLLFLFLKVYLSFCPLSCPNDLEKDFSVVLFNREASAECFDKPPPRQLYLFHSKDIVQALLIRMFPMFDIPSFIKIVSTSPKVETRLSYNKLKPQSIW